MAKGLALNASVGRDWTKGWHGRLILLQAAEKAAQGETSDMGEYVEELQRGTTLTHGNREKGAESSRRCDGWLVNKYGCFRVLCKPEPTR
jgi:hypothetical protein